MGDTNPTNLLTPFDEETQLLLLQVDNACAQVLAGFKEEANKASLANKELEVDIEAIVWSRIIKAYGVLMNRAIECGWVEGIQVENKE